MPDELLYVDDRKRTLRLEFVRKGDRHRQHIYVQQAGLERLVASSLEGNDQELWPSSPPLQELSIERRGTGDVALLVGMSGKCHWSLSVEVVAGGLEFDAACRISGETGWLGSTYLAEPPGSEPFADREPVAGHPGPPGGVHDRDLTGEETLRLGAAGLVVASNDHCRMEAGRLTIRPPGDDRHGPTVRWRYRLRLE